MSTKIVIDSTVDIIEEQRSSVYMVPLTVRFGREEFLDRVTISCEEFYTRLAGCKELPSTSQPSPAAFAAVYDEISAAGDEAVVLTISAKISGTYQSACIAAEGYDNIHVVDSKSCSIGSGALAERAIELAERGMGAAELARTLEKERDEIFVVTTLDTLENLAKGGRLPKAVAVAGGILNIKPIGNMRDGEVAILAKVRGMKQAFKQLIAEIHKACEIDMDRPILLGYTGLSDENLRKFIDSTANVWQHRAEGIHVAKIGTAIGTHSGAGAVAAAVFKRMN